MDQMLQEQETILAQERIQELEARLESRERELRLLHDRQRQRLNPGRWFRRRSARSGDRDLFGRNRVCSEENSAGMLPDLALIRLLLTTVIQ